MKLNSNQNVTKLGFFEEVRSSQILKLLVEFYGK